MSHYKSYPAYKDSGVEWLGAVPEHWKVFPLKRDLVFLTSGSRGWAEHYAENGALFLRIGNLRRDRLELDLFDCQRVEVPIGSEGERTKVLAGDVLFSITAYLGSVAVVPSGIEKAYVSQHVALARIGGAFLTARWVGYITISWVGKTYLESEGYGGTKIQLSLDDIANMVMTAPLPAEQAIIVRYLDRETARIDALVEKKARFIELLREKRQALITHAVTKGLDPNVKMKESGVEWLGEVPEHWDVKRLKFIASVQTGIAKGKDNADKDTIGVPYLRVANVQDGYLDLDEVATIEVVPADVARYLLQPGDVLMNEGGDFDKLGRGHVWQGEIDPCIHQNHVFAVRPHSVFSEWLNTVTSSGFAQFYFMGRSKQSTNLASISSTNLMELPVPLPSKSEQLLTLEKMRSLTSQLDALLTRTEHSIVLLKERRSALITAAVTGQIDLREAI